MFNFQFLVDFLNQYLGLQSLINSDGFLGSIQFAFTAILTLLIPLIISLFDKRNNPRYDLDRKVIDNLINFNWLVVSIFLSTVSIFLINNNKTPDTWLFDLIILVILLISYIYLIWVNVRVARALVDLQPFRETFLKKQKTDDILDFWEEYFFQLNNSKKDQEDVDNLETRTRYKYKFINEEKKWLKLFFGKINSLSFSKDINFLSQILEIFYQNLSSINLENLLSINLSEVENTKLTPLEKLFGWHFLVFTKNFAKQKNEISPIEKQLDQIIEAIKTNCFNANKPEFLESYQQIAKNQLELIEVELAKHPKYKDYLNHTKKWLHLEIKKKKPV